MQEDIIEPLSIEDSGGDQESFPPRVLMLGLDEAGKTTLLYRIRLGETISSVPTIGFNVETLTFDSMKLAIWDVGGKPNMRPLWRHYADNTAALIFVVDSGNREKVIESGQVLHDFLKEREEELKDTILLVFANKQDMGIATTVSVAEVTELLWLNQLHGRTWYCTGCSAVLGQGINEGLTWLVQELRKKQTPQV